MTITVKQLRAMECPHCQNSDQLKVRIRRWVDLNTFSQTITVKTLDHSGEDLCECKACGWAGDCWDAYTARWQRELREAANTPVQSEPNERERPGDFYDPY